MWLDVSTAEGLRAYDEIGFELIEEWTVDAGPAGKGIKLSGRCYRRRKRGGAESHQAKSHGEDAGRLEEDSPWL